MRPIRETFDADQPSRSATSLPCNWAAPPSTGSSAARGRSRADGVVHHSDTRRHACVQSCKSAFAAEARFGNVRVQRLQSYPAPPTEGRTDMNGLGTRLRSSNKRHLHSVDLYDIAYLAGGHIRVADTVVVALVERGQLRVAPDGQLSVIRLGRRHPVEAAALDAIGTRGWRSVDSVRWRFEDDPRLSGIAERLAQDGLLRPTIMPFPGRRRLVHRTRAGRQLLRRLRTQPPADAVPGGTSAPLVALDGPERVSN